MPWSPGNEDRSPGFTARVCILLSSFSEPQFSNLCIAEEGACPPGDVRITREAASIIRAWQGVADGTIVIKAPQCWERRGGQKKLSRAGDKLDLGEQVRRVPGRGNSLCRGSEVGLTHGQHNWGGSQLSPCSRL